MISYSLAPGGAERFVVDLSNLLVMHGHEVYVLTTNNDDIGQNSFYLPELSSKVNYINIKAKSGHEIRALLGIPKYIRALKPDVVHSHTDLLQLLLPLFTQHRPKYLHTIHSVADFYLPGKIWRPLFKYIYSHRVCAVTISQTCSKSFRSLYGINTDVRIDNGRTKPAVSAQFGDIRREVLQFKGGKYLFVHIARYAAPKRQDVLFDAFKSIDAKLLVVGGGFPDSLVAQQDASKVMFVGVRNNVADYLALADFFVMSSSFEGLPLSLLEAMSYGVIPISTPAGGVVDIIEDGKTGYLSNGFSSESISEAICRAMQGNVSRTSVINLYERNYLMDNCADRYQKLYKATCTGCYMLSNWARKKELTWSGTNYGLYNAIRKRIPLGDIDLERIKPPLLARILRRFGRTIEQDLGFSQIFRQRKALANRGLHGVILQFAEVLEDSDDLSTFIYQDLSVDYLSYMYHNLPEVFAVSSYQNTKPDYIEKRRNLQNDYYVNHCKGIFTMGEWLRLDLIKRTGINPSKVFAVGGGINLDPSLISDKPKDRKRILFVGRDFERKGGPLTISAFRILKQSMPNAELYVAGPASDPICGESLSGYHFMGDCNHDQLSQLFNLCDIFCMPSIFEAYGLVFIEALCYGLPCIGRNRYEMPFFIEDGKTGFLMKGDMPEELCSYMITLLNEESFYDNVKLGKQKYLSEYSWDAVADRMLNVMVPQ